MDGRIVTIDGDSLIRVGGIPLCRLVGTRLLFMDKKNCNRTVARGGRLVDVDTLQFIADLTAIFAEQNKCGP